MKCPFLGTMRQDGKIKPIFADCIKEECALWKEECAFLTIALELEKIKKGILK